MGIIITILLLPGQNAAPAPVSELHKHKYRRSRVLRTRKLCQDDDKARRDFYLPELSQEYGQTQLLSNARPDGKHTKYNDFLTN